MRPRGGRGIREERDFYNTCLEILCYFAGGGGVISPLRFFSLHFPAISSDSILLQ